MTVTTQDLSNFHQFAESRIAAGESDVSFDELVEQWLLETQCDEEIEASVASMNRGLADIAAGRVRSAEDVFQDLAVRFQVELEP